MVIFTPATVCVPPLIHRCDLLDAFFLQPQTEFVDAHGDRIALLAHFDRVPDVIAVPVSAEQRVGLLDLLLTFRAHGIAGNPRINVQRLPFRRLDAESGVAQPCELDSLQIHDALLS
jgi:hypothetical protein